jgi:hypothetical protein
MRRTTICRSEALSAVGVAVLTAALPVMAQQAPVGAGRRAVEQAQRAAQQGQQPAQAQRPAPQAGAVVQGVPAVHVVQQGETLWQLAQQYFGDPLLWPEIYRLNTGVVEDPHWIFPGEELRLQPGEEELAMEPQPQAITVTPTGDTVRAPVQPAPIRPTTGPTIFSEASQARMMGTAIDTRVEASYRAVRPGEYYSSGFLTEGEPLETGRVVANLETSLRGNIRTRTSAAAFEQVVIDPPGGVPLDTGTLLLALRRGEEVPGYGQIVHPTGLLRVTGEAGVRQRAQLLRPFDRVTDGQELLPIAPFRFDNERRPEPTTEQLEAQVLRLRDRREVATLQDVLFLDRGAGDGVRLGDVFLVFAEQPDQQGGVLVQQQAHVLVVSTRERTATAVIIDLVRGDISSRSLARLVRRIPT